MKAKWAHDESAALWLESSAGTTVVADKLKNLRHDQVLGQLNTIINEHPDIALESINQLVESTSSEKIKELIGMLTEKLNAALVTQGASPPQEFSTPLMPASGVRLQQQSNNASTPTLPPSSANNSKN
jgi:adenine-specific DNA methylase